MRKGQPFNPTQTPRRRKAKPRPLKLRTAPNRDKLIRKDLGVLNPVGRKGRPVAQPHRRKPGKGKPPAKPVDPFDAQVQAALELKFGGAAQEAEYEQRVSAQQQTNIGGWYDQYLNDLQRGAQLTAQVYGQGQQGVYGQANLAAGQDQARMGQNQQAAQASAAQRGTTASVQPEQAGAIGARQAQGSAFGGLLAAHGGAAATLDAGRFAAAAAARVGAHQQEQARAVEVREGARKLMAQRGAEAVTLRAGFSDEAFKKELLTQQFGLDVRAQGEKEKQARREARLKRAQLKLDRLDTIADNRRLTATERRQRANLNETIRHHGRLEEQAASDEAGRNARDNGDGGDSAGTITPSQRRGYQQDFDAAVAGVNTAWTYKNGVFSFRDTNGKIQKQNLDQVVAALVASRNIKPMIAKVAVLTAINKPIPPKLAKRARYFGIKNLPRPARPLVRGGPGTVRLAD